LSKKKGGGKIVGLPYSLLEETGFRERSETTEREKKDRNVQFRLCLNKKRGKERRGNCLPPAEKGEDNGLKIWGRGGGLKTTQHGCERGGGEEKKKFRWIKK